MSWILRFRSNTGKRGEREVRSLPGRSLFSFSLFFGGLSAADPGQRPIGGVETDGGGGVRPDDDDDERERGKLLLLLQKEGSRELMLL